MTSIALQKFNLTSSLSANGSSGGNKNSVERLFKMK